MGYTADVGNRTEGINGLWLFGRKTIYSSADVIDESNVIEQVNAAMSIHIQNLLAEDYLYWYRRGIAPILNRHKIVRPEINNKIREGSGIADAITTFKDGWFLTQPAYYISRKEDAQDSVDALNEYLYLSGKHDADNEVVDWFHTVGKGALFVRSTDNNDKPVEAYALDPRSAFVVYSMKPDREPIMACYTVVDGENVKIDVFTKERIFRVSGSVAGEIISSYPNYTATAVSVDKVEPNPLGEIPIIEYQYNSVGMSCFENALDLLDSLDKLSSNRSDAVEQFVQSLLVFYNCELPNGDDGESITVREIRESGALFLKSFGENKADLKEISSQLDQTQTQVLVDYVYGQIQRICAMPLVQEGRTYDATGTAAIVNSGWFQADVAARNTEDLFKKSNRRFDEIFCKILRKKGLLDIKPTEFELNFVRNETANIQSKAQAFQTLMQAGMHPELAAAKSGVSNDPVADIKMSEPYIKMVWGDPTKVDEVEEQTDGRGEARIVESDGENRSNISGAV